MGNRIIVAGGGHGGIAAAAILAGAGYDVTVFEKNERENMGYDWTDIFDKKGLFAAGMELPPEDKYCYKENMTFLTPSENTALRQHVPQDQLEIKMERKEIYNHIIAHAEKCGVRFEYGVSVEAPIMCGNRVVGIKTDKGDEYASLVIDAAGIDSPVRRGLPAYLGIQNETNHYDQFYVYRAFYNKAAEQTEDKFEVILFNDGIPGLTWVASEEEHTDVLIGRFDPFDLDEVKRTTDLLREKHPSIGTEKVRGGQFVKIPIRQALARIVCDGYAAIGDAAFMTVPIIGSGIANSFKAARMLADAVIADKNNAYSASSLWKYQRDFFEQLGSGLAPVAGIKLMLSKISPEELDYMFDRQILSEEDMTIGSDATSIGAFLHGFTPAAIKIKAVALKDNPALLKKVLKLAAQIGKIVAACAAMPKEYEESKVLKWIDKYNNSFIMK